MCVRLSLHLSLYVSFVCVVTGVIAVVGVVGVLPVALFCSV